MADQTLNVPSLVFVILITSLAIRYFFFTPSNPRTPAQGRQVDPAQVDHLSSMFPQADRRAIQWDLQRNGGSVAATTERMLTRGSLDTPPPSFQPQLPPPPTSSTITVAPVPAAAHPDLITRYNLRGKVGKQQTSSETTEEDGAAKCTWSESKSERAELLQKRREQMILNARRKMEQKAKQPS